LKILEISQLARGHKKGKSASHHFRFVYFPMKINFFFLTVFPSFLAVVFAIPWSSTEDDDDLHPEMSIVGFCALQPFPESKTMDAAQSGDLSILIEAYVEDPKLDLQEEINAATSSGHLEILKWAWEDGPHIIPDSDSIEDASHSGYLDILKWLHSVQPEWTPSQCAVDRAAEGGQVDVLRWFKTGFCQQPTDDGIKSAIVHGHIGVLQWQREVCPEWNLCADMSEVACDFGHLEILKLANEWDPTNLPTEKGISLAIEWGHFDLIKWIYSRNVDFVREQAELVAKAGQLKIFQWLDEMFPGIMCTAKMFKIAFRACKRPILDYILTLNKSLVPNQEDINSAAEQGCTELLQWAMSMFSIMPDQEGINLAAKSGALRVLQWAYKINKKLLPNQDGINAATLKGNANVLTWMESTKEACQ
jgi:hypothetical protein